MRRSPTEATAARAPLASPLPLHWKQMTMTTMPLRSPRCADHHPPPHHLLRPLEHRQHSFPGCSSPEKLTVTLSRWVSLPSLYFSPSDRDPLAQIISLNQIDTSRSGPFDALLIQQFWSPVRPKRYALIALRHMSSPGADQIQLDSNTFKISANLQNSYISNHASKIHKLYVSGKLTMSRFQWCNNIP
jgi:hypothetical protein